MESARKERLVIDLGATFVLEDVDGRPVPISSLNGRRLLAILARSRRMSRSRSILQTLLWDDRIADAGASLRQLLYKVSQALGPHRECLQSDAHQIWLEGVRDRTAPDVERQTVFFEDAGFGTEEFEDWLREERSRFEDTPRPPPAAPPPHSKAAPLPAQMRRAKRVRAGLVNPFASEIDTRAGFVTNWLSNCIRDVMYANDFLDFHDLRGRDDLSSECDLLIEIGVIPFGHSFDLSLAAIRTADRTCLWSQTRQVSLGADGLETGRDGLMEFVSASVSSIEHCVARFEEFEKLPWAEAPLYEVVCRMFSLSAPEVRRCSETLDAYEGQEDSATIQAWRAFSHMLLAGERLTNDRDAALATAEGAIARALDAGPMNATALAVAAHDAAFNARDFARARELVEDSLRIAPKFAFGRDVQAMCALYSGDVARGSRYAEMAVRLGRFSPLRAYLEGSTVVAATLRGDHARAIAEGLRVLERRPSFLPVLRHVTASFATLGQRNEAARLLDHTRRLDPAFGTGDMLAPEYPLPSEASRTFIYASLAGLGLAR